MSTTPALSFRLPDGTTRAVQVRSLLNAGYSGRARDEVAVHVAELARLGVPAPATTPALYPVAPYLAAQPDSVPAQHGRTSGEAEWALVVAGPAHEDVLLTAACDHTDRALEVHGWPGARTPGSTSCPSPRRLRRADRPDVRDDRHGRHVCLPAAGHAARPVHEHDRLPDARHHPAALMREDSICTSTTSTMQADAPWLSLAGRSRPRADPTTTPTATRSRPGRVSTVRCTLRPRSPP